MIQDQVDYDRLDNILERYKQKNLIESSFTRKLDLIKNCINDITSEIEERNELHVQLSANMDSQLKNTEFFLDDFIKLRKGTMYHPDKRIQFFESQINKLKHEKRKEESGIWRDITELKRELRVLLKEYRNGISNRNILRDFKEF